VAYLVDRKKMTEIALIVGRILFALLFINSGIAHFTKNSAMTGYAQYKKVPFARVSVYISGVMILLGGLYIALGFYADLGALLIAIFLIPTAFLMHAFWKESDATAKQNETIGFFKDLSLAGAALIIFALLRGGADFGSNVGTLLFFS
jgi:uncharacterized membrane protein YphA (DoxX/SURF4 family)